jgi:hypothetical protein
MNRGAEAMPSPHRGPNTPHHDVGSVIICARPGVHVSDHHNPDGAAECRWFLCTDIEGSTARWDRHPGEMDRAMARHDVLLTAAIEAAQGSVFKHSGDGLLAVFDSPRNALRAAVEGQCAIRGLQVVDRTAAST